ncbi:uncharacterized protein PG998_014970 [Apiospora kogelbergensis]|uniref:uncharacterized protein n=1 Tax=Apiospora kogelbergensis TaxID=1337665 RepID=UPI00312F4182
MGKERVRRRIRSYSIEDRRGDMDRCANPSIPPRGNRGAKDLDGSSIGQADFVLEDGNIDTNELCVLEIDGNEIAVCEKLTHGPNWDGRRPAGTHDLKF